MKRAIVLLATALLVAGCARLRPPVLLEEKKPNYPEEARLKGLEGTVTLHLLVTETGDVKYARVVKSSGYPILDSAAVAYGKTLKFRPATKRGKPVPVWLSWNVKYEALAAQFLPKEYVANMQKWYAQAAKLSKDDPQRRDVLQKILNADEEYVLFLKKNPTVNLNPWLSKFVLRKVRTTWIDFWDVWPLRFAPYHDFVLRFPDDPESGYAANQLILLLKEDIRRLKRVLPTDDVLYPKRDRLVREIYAFLAKNYPESLTGEFRKDAEKYLGKLK